MDQTGSDLAGAPISSQIAAFAANLSFDHVPPKIVDHARNLMLDAVGCALAAQPEDFTQRYIDAITELSGVKTDGAGCAIIGQSLRLPMRDAALLNGVLAHGLDFDDTHITGIAHLSAAVLPAVMALGAQNAVSGQRMLHYYILGLEIGSRLASAAPGLFHECGFHPTVTVGIFAAAVACAGLLGLDRQGLERAQGFALSMAGGTLQFVEDGAWTKRMHPGWAASSGIACAIMARQPIPTPHKVYEGRFGLYRAFLGASNMARVHLDQITADQGSTWQLMGIGVKPFPVCHFNHGCADAAIALHGRMARSGLKVQAIRRIEARVPHGVMSSVCEPVDIKRTPSSDYEAKFSMHYAVACGLLRGHLGLADLAPDAVRDPDARALMQLIDCTPDPSTTFPRHFTGEVRVFFDDGTTLVHREAINRGHADRPMDGAEIRAKFRANAGLSFPGERVQALEESILSIDVQSDVRALDTLLTALPFPHVSNQGTFS